ncbi:MAG: hypothetical protein RHS_3970 [Robinsoniella sp. RHS]|nr:MAG: hypothetical protein RHS_3970 [Robinsoniella sp. RHS]
MGSGGPAWTAKATDRVHAGPPLPIFPDTIQNLQSVINQQNTNFMFS